MSYRSQAARYFTVFTMNTQYFATNNTFPQLPSCVGTRDTQGALLNIARPRYGRSGKLSRRREEIWLSVSTAVDARCGNTVRMRAYGNGGDAASRMRRRSSAVGPSV